MNTKTSRGQGIRCSSCGGTFPLQTLAAAVLCPYCGAQQSLAGTAIRRVQQYRHDVFAEMRAADADRQQASTWSQWTSGGSQIWMMIVPLTFLLPFCISVPTMLLAMGHVALPPAISNVLGNVGGLCTTFVVMAALGASSWMRSRQKRGASQRGPSVASKVACPHCGAPNRLVAGEHVHTCSYCGGALMPSKTVMVQSLDAVRAERRRAALERYRAERHGMMNAGASSRTTMRLAPLYYVVPFAPMSLFCLVGILGAAKETQAFWPLLAVAVMVVSLVAGALGLVALRWWRRRESWRRGLAQLATQFHGRASTQIADLVSWLDTYWAGPFDVRKLLGGPRFAVVALDAWGYSGVLALSPARMLLDTSNAYPTYAQVVLAGWVPSATEGHGSPPIGDAARATLGWLEAAGFSVSFEEAGVVASALPWVIERLRRQPDVVGQLAPVVAHVVRLAYELGVQPVTST